MSDLGAIGTDAVALISANVLAIQIPMEPLPVKYGSIATILGDSSPQPISTPGKQKVGMLVSDPNLSSQ